MAAASLPGDAAGTEPRRRAWLTLIRAAGLSSAAIHALIDRFGAPEAVLDAGPAAWRAAGLSTAVRQSLAQPDAERLAQDLEWLSIAGHQLIPYTDARYPARLREIPQPPCALFTIGQAELLALPQLAIIGARSATPQGLADAEAFAAELSRRGLLVTSGLALGIDGAAHRGALAAGGATVAVCGTGLDRVYPARHQALAHEIAAQGLLVSEFPPATPPRPENFPRRNRIISGLSLGVLVVEAARESGSLITARLAGDQGREVFAIPGSIHNPMSRGCHRLIRQGAKLVETVDDIFEELAPQIRLQWLSPSRPAEAPEAELAEPLRQLWQALGTSPADLDTLVERLQIPVGDLLARLMQLEIEGLAAPTADGRYMAVRGPAPSRRR